VERTTIAGEAEELGENLPQRHFVPPQIPHDQVRFRTLDRSGGKPATNHLSYGAPYPIALVRLEGLGQLKNQITSSGNEPTTFWLVA
jgi:hypothetical protein